MEMVDAETYSGGKFRLGAGFEVIQQFLRI